MYSSPFSAGVLAISLNVVFLGAFGATRCAVAENWPGWRGPRGDGSSLEDEVPVRWSGESGENIAWKSPLPGWGHSSPIVWEDRVFLVSCLEEEQTRRLLGPDREPG